MVRLCFNSRSLILSRCCFDHAANTRSPPRRNVRPVDGQRTKQAHRFSGTSSKRVRNRAMPRLKREDPEHRPSARETSSRLSVCLTCGRGGCGLRGQGRKTTQCLRLACFGQPVFKLAALGGYPADTHTDPQTHTHTHTLSFRPGRQ